MTSKTLIVVLVTEVNGLVDEAVDLYNNSKNTVCTFFISRDGSSLLNVPNEKKRLDLNYAVISASQWVWMTVYSKQKSPQTCGVLNKILYLNSVGYAWGLTTLLSGSQEYCLPGTRKYEIKLNVFIRRC